MTNGGASPPVPTVGAVTPSSPDLAVTSNLAPAAIMVHLRLRFLEPENNVSRPFPPGLVVKVLNNEYPVRDSGYVSFPAVRPSPPGKWQFTLEFPATTPRYVVCEPWAPAGSPAPSPPPSPPGGSPPSYPYLAAAAPDTTERYFMMPSDFGSPMQPWALINSNWQMTNPNNVTFAAPRGMLEHQNADQPIGTAANPVVLTLNPGWLFFRFEYFDRYYGHTDHGNARITVPPMPLEGFRNDRPAAGANPDVKSNWVVGDNARSLYQCLPFIDLKDRAGSPPGSPLDGQHIGLRLQYTDDRYVFSESADVRRVVSIAAGDIRLRPGLERLKYYDLPRLWKSRQYYTRWTASPAGGDFFNSLNAAKLLGSTDRSKALTFCLDDIVLYEAGGANIQPLAAWANTDRVAIFNHRFNGTIGGASTAKHGIYKNTTTLASMADVNNIPQSEVDVVRTPQAAGARDTYLTDYPDWTRLVVTQGNLFDVFDQRAPASNDADRVVGARAAMRWVDTTIAPINPGVGTAIPARPARVDKPCFVLQPFHGQNTSRFAHAYNPAQSSFFGRIDMLLLRCCDVTAGNEELATNLHFVRSYWHNSPGKAWNLNCGVNTSNRWNGDDSINNCRGVLVPDGSPAAPLRVQVVWFDQSAAEAKAHYKLTPGAGRSNRSFVGTGEYSPGDNTSQASGWHTSAHESGHMNGMPDDYNERWSCASYDQLSFRHNGPPGDPYELDGRADPTQYGTANAAGTEWEGAMMNINTRLRGRLYWPSAEWVSRVCGYPFKVKFKDILSSPATEYEYSLPPHPDRDHDMTYLSWPFLNNRSASTNAIPPGASPGSPAPAGTPWDSFEYNLYTLGKEYYSQELLGNLVKNALGLAGTPRFDGLLMVVLRLRCTMPADATVGTEDTLRKDIATQIVVALRRALCYRWRLKGNFGSPPVHFVDGALIHFSPQIVVENDPHGHYAAKKWTAPNLASPNWLLNEFREHFSLEVKESTSSVPAAASYWDIPNRKLLVEYRPGQTGDINTEMESKYPRFFGFDVNPAAVTIARITNIVNLLNGSGVTVEAIT